MNALATYALRFGDNALVLGQRLAAWTGHAPVLEEDLALTNVALDLIGQARHWLAYAGRCEGLGRDEDALAYFRDQHEFVNVLLVERPNGDFAATMARQFFFDRFHLLALRALATSGDGQIAGIAGKAAKEVAYHAERSADWLVRLGDGTDVSHARMQAAVDDLWPYTGELFLGDDIDREMAERGIGFDPASLRDAWHADVALACESATLVLPAATFAHTGGKRGRHSEHLSYLLAEMQAVRRGIVAERW
ncbi:MAG: phenylacetate-CoA oxygenase subunit PaaC [Vulcanimicrobiaceae bacterium]